MTTETFKVEVLGIPEMERLAALGSKLKRTSDAAKGSIGKLNEEFEAIGKSLEVGTDGFDKVRASVDATTDRLRLFGARGRAIADAIDDNISDPAERAERAMTELRRELSRTPTTLDRANESFRRARADLDIFLARLGPVGTALGAAGVAGAFAVAAGGALAFKAAIDATSEAARRFIRDNEALSKSADKLDNSFESLVQTFGAAVVGGEGFKRVIDEISRAVDKATQFIADHSEEIGGFFRTVALDALSIAESAVTGIQAILFPVLGVIDLAKIGMYALVLDAARLTTELLDLVKPLNDALGIVSPTNFSAARAAAGGLERAALGARNDAQSNALTVSLIDTGKELKNTIRSLKQAILGIDGDTGVVRPAGARGSGGGRRRQDEGFIGVPDALIAEERTKRNVAFVVEANRALRRDPAFLREAQRGRALLDRDGQAGFKDFKFESELLIKEFEAEKLRNELQTRDARKREETIKKMEESIANSIKGIGASFAGLTTQIVSGSATIQSAFQSLYNSVQGVGEASSQRLISTGVEAGSAGLIATGLGVGAGVGLLGRFFGGIIGAPGRRQRQRQQARTADRQRRDRLVNAINSLEQTIRARDEREQQIVIQNLAITGRSVGNLIVDTTAAAIDTIERNNLGGSIGRIEG